MTVVVPGRAVRLSGGGAHVPERHRLRGVEVHDCPPSNICSMKVHLAPDTANGLSETRWVHLWVHRRGAGEPTPLLPYVPPTGIEPATFGTGNQRLLRTDHSRRPKFRVIPGLRLGASGWVQVVNGYTSWVHLLLSERNGSILICMDNRVCAERDALADLIEYAGTCWQIEHGKRSIPLADFVANIVIGSDLWRHRQLADTDAAHREGFMRGWRSARTHGDIAAATHSPDFRAHWREPAANDDSEDAIIPIDPSKPRRSLWGEAILDDTELLAAVAVMSGSHLADALAAARAVMRTKTLGTLRDAEFDVLDDMGVPLYRWLGEYFDLAPAAVDDLIGSGGVSAGDFVKAIVRGAL